PRHGRAASAALYRSLRRSPVAAATSAHTSLSPPPAATRACIAATALSGSIPSAGAPPTTTVISPLTPAAAHAARSARVPRLTSSYVLVSSRHTAAGRSGPNASAIAARVAS